MSDDRPADRLVLRQVVLDCRRPRLLAEFYRQLLGWDYRAGDEPPADGADDPAGDDWLVIVHRSGRRVAFQAVPDLPEPTWPDGPHPQMLHLDLSVADRESLLVEHGRVLALGGRMLLDRIDDEDEALRVYADPAGHPFCIFVAPDHPAGG